MAIFPQFGPDPESSLLQQCQYIIHRVTVLLDELERLKAAIERRPASGHKPVAWNQAVPGLGLFERLIISEKKHLAKMVQAYDVEPGEEVDTEALDSRIRLRLDASNYKFYETVWEVTKRCCDLAGMRRELAYKTVGEKSISAVIDLVVNGGADWVKVVTTTERRLFYEMADAGWDWEEDFTDEGADQSMLEVLQDETEDSIEVAKVARHMVAAARTSYQDYRRPRVRILMSRISEGENESVDHLLRLVRKMGGDDVDLLVETANGAGILTDPTPDLEETISNLVNTDYYKDFTQTVNVDCSVFMALASDFSHMAIGPDSDLLRSKQHRIDATDEVENGPRLVNTLYPAITGRTLVCTREAADTFLKIVYEIGTDSEQSRTRILFDPSDADTVPEDVEQDRRRRVAALQELSVHPVPADLRLPVEIVDSVSWDDAQRMVAEGQLPAVALAVGKRGSGLNAMNVSSFLYGWTTRLTTVTSNWEAAKRLRTVIETNRVTGTEVGPHIWRIPFSRKLLAKPKVPLPSGGGGRGEKEDGNGSSGSWRLKTRQERKAEKEESLQSWVASEQAETPAKSTTPDVE
ncbi:hypothetical protein CORC01_06955 [Colletotrichum orchidophilum]|uniref:DUF1308 domain-containing protein n=1 Tax=Colletotrichum orchidophilum TaxID=1209926 RepID=A0A1G4B8H6_9PEZI|nr:uncharacterized protein CORC01_06955 [Colletotrichum orchidophilum]OHE97750.1 hypothetical protein CORC01_06955 [Colletotrichum orchidophilum]